MEKYIDVETVRVIAHDYLCVQQDEDAFMEEIDKASTSDVAPVRRGIWRQPGTRGAEESLWCSACGAGPHLYPWRCCPDCGARMDGQAAAQ